MEIHAQGIAKEQSRQEDEQYQMRINITPDRHRVYEHVIIVSLEAHSISNAYEEQHYCILNLFHETRYEIRDLCNDSRDDVSYKIHKENVHVQR